MENEEYNPVEPNYYNYKGKNYLTQDFSREITTYDNIYLCPYTVNNDSKFPFIRFLLTNSPINKTLNFQIIPIFKNFNSDELKIFTKFYLFGLLLLNDFETFNRSVIFNGYFDYNNNLYLFFDITNCCLEINDTYSNNCLWLALVDEILNYKKICNMHIDDDVTQFFNLNESFCFLDDENENNYEIPVVGYVKKSEDKLNFTYIFGETKKDKNSLLGPYYYFTNYYSCFKDSENQTECNKKIGIVKFALFTGKTKYIENYPSDAIDESEIKKQRLYDESLDQNLERLTMRITDHDGKWSNDYDSVYLGNVELDNGDLFKKQILVLKEYYQQKPLSYHYIRNVNSSMKLEDYLIV